MTAPFPPPDATREQVEAFEIATTEAAVAKLRAEVGRKPRTCSSCGETGGHRRGDRACLNYATSWRWGDHRKVWAPPPAEGFRPSKEQP